MSGANNWHRFAALLVMAFTVALAGCGKKDDSPKAEGAPKPAETPKVGPKPAEPKGEPKPPTPAPPTPSESLAKAKPDVVLPTKLWCEETKKDYNFLFNKYPGQIIEVSGVVDDYIGSEVFVRAGEHEGIDTVRCPVIGKRPWTKVLPTQTVTLRARVVTPFVWEIVDTKGVLPPTFTVEQLIKANTAEEFKRGWAIVTGTIGKVERAENGDFTLFLTIAETETLKCVFHHLRKTHSSEQDAFLKTGQKVKILGRYSLGDLSSCIILEPAP